VHGGVRTRTKDLGAVKRVKIRAQLVCFKGQWLLGCPSDQEGQAGGRQLFYTKGRSSRVREGGGTGDAGEGMVQGFRVCSPCCRLGPARRQARLVGRKRKERERKERDV
jgi:hypothetical protein